MYTYNIPKMPAQKKTQKKTKLKKGGGVLADNILNRIVTIKLPLRTIINSTKSIYMSGKTGKPYSLALVKTLF
jgi:hypothetical protein